ncbi:MAG TPA: formyltetrahydrofolate deformylase [Thermoanaerobaculia bacterium]|nr:formyltetrahydrofolate deformylase [Thermoanaerobaculia bacterium]
MNVSENETGGPRAVTLLLHCPLRLGLAAGLTQFVYTHGGRILDHEQYVDTESDHYYTRLKWDISSFSTTNPEIAERLRALIGSGPETEWSLHDSNQVLRMALFASKDPWCLYDILARSHSGEWAVEVPVIVSNHADLEPVARRFGVEFRRFSVTKESRSEAEDEQLALLQSHRIDVVVLARYMQILTGRFVQAYPSRIINIHHAFLPAFPGARPYHSARERGVKIIGATSHYVTETLDAGPIIEQDVLHVSHRHSVQDLIRSGRDLEKVVLSRAIRRHLERKIIVHRGRTVVFH